MAQVKFRVGYSVMHPHSGSDRDLWLVTGEIMRSIFPEETPYWEAQNFEYENYAAYGIVITCDKLTEQEDIDVGIHRQLGDSIGFIYEGRICLIL